MVDSTSRPLPAIPLTATTTSSQRQQQRQTESSTWFDESGHYAYVHLNADNVGGCGGAARMPLWQRSYVDDSGHYDVVMFTKPTDNNSTEEQLPRTPGVYSYAAVHTGVPTNRPGLHTLHSYLEVIGYSGTSSDEVGTTAENNNGLDPVEEEE